MIARRCACLGAALLLPIMSVAAEVRITGIPSPNRVKNPSLELGSQRQPAHWTFNTAQPENFTARWTGGARTGKYGLHVNAESGKMSGYWTQVVTVEPGRTYRFKGYYRLRGGRMLIWVNGAAALPDGTKVKVDRRFYAVSSRGHWLEPVFLPPEALSGPDPNAWLPFELDVKVPAPITRLTFSMGMYFTPGEVSFDDLWVGPAEMDLAVSVKAAPGERIEQVVIRTGKPAVVVFDSGPLPKVTTFEKTLKAQPLDGNYEVEARLANGKIMREAYPRNEQEKGR